MQPRLNYRNVAPGALKIMLDIEAYLAKCGLERPPLAESVEHRGRDRARASTEVG